MKLGKLRLIIGCGIFPLVAFSLPVTTNESTNIGPLLFHIVEPINENLILFDTNPLPGIRETKIRITACRGEFEPASFLLQPRDRDINNLRIQVSDLSNGTAIIPKTNVNIRVVKAWYQAGSAWKGIRQNPKAVLVPELLLKDDQLISTQDNPKENFIKLRYPNEDIFIPLGINPGSRERIMHDAIQFPVMDTTDLQPIFIKKNTNKQLWVTVKIPIDQISGIYKGKIHFFEGKNSLGMASVQVQVLPFELSPSRLTHSIYYRGKLKIGIPTMSSEFKTPEQLHAEFQNMVDHGITNPTIYQDFRNKYMFDQVLATRKKIGFDNRELFYLGFQLPIPKSTKEYGVLGDRIQLVQRLASNYGIKTIHFYGIDEAEGHVLKSQKKVWNFVHRMGSSIFAAGKVGNFKLIGKQLDVLIAAYQPNENEARLYNKIGHRVFSYANPQVGVENPYIYRRNYGLLLWQAGYDGAMDYAYQHSEGSVWNDFDGRYRDHMFTYPTVNGVIDTIAWEGFREGVDDIRYLSTLLEYMEKLNSQNNQDAKEAVFKASTYLKGLKMSELADLKDIRKNIIDHILKLHHFTVRKNLHKPNNDLTNS